MSFKSDVLKVASGTAVAQAITLAAAPILSRLFAPEAFGAAALFASAIALLSGFVCLCYEQAIVLVREDGEAANLLALCLGLATASALLIGLALWLGHSLIVTWRGVEHIVPYLYLLPLAAFMQGVFVALSQWNARTKQFGRLSAAQVAGQLTVSSLNVTGGIIGRTTGGTMILASIAGQAVSLAALGGRILRDQRSLLSRSIRPAAMLEQLKRHRNFPRYTSWSVLVNAASWQLPVFMLGALFPAAIVGFYALGFRVMQLPMSLIGRSISQVFLQRAAVEHLQGDLTDLVKRLIQKLLIAGMLPCLILTIIGRELFVFAFGANWAEAGVYIQMLAPWALIWFISSPLSSLYYVVGRQREEMHLQVLIFGSRIAALGIGGYLGNARLAVLLFACSGILAYGYLVKVLLGLVRLGLRAVLAECATATRDALLLAAPLLALKLMDARPAVLFAAAAVALACFGARHGRVLKSA